MLNLFNVTLQFSVENCYHFETAAWLAQLGERGSAEREVTGSNPGLTNIQGLLISEKKVLFYNDIYKWLDFLVFSDKDE